MRDPPAPANEPGTQGTGPPATDPRIKASAILTGGAFGFDGQWFPPGTPPVLFIHATADEVNPYWASEQPCSVRAR